MLDAFEAFSGRAPDALSRRIGCDEVRKIFFQFLKLREKLVVFPVGYELPTYNVIGMIVPADLLDELRVAGLSFFECHGGIVESALGVWTVISARCQAESCRRYSRLPPTRKFG